MVGKSGVKLRKLAGQLANNGAIILTTDLKEIYLADIVVTTTSHPQALIEARYLKPGAVIYDVAQPRNVSPDLIKERPDVLIIDGAYTNINGIELGFDMGPPAKTTFACLAETILESLENDNSDYVGEVEIANVAKMRQWAEKHGFSPAPFSCFDKRISLDVLEALKARTIN